MHEVVDQNDHMTKKEKVKKEKAAWTIPPEKEVIDVDAEPNAV